jgi:glucan phosphoethanolaminetransferase (alkaline phosphatase superfamily)
VNCGLNLRQRLAVLGLPEFWAVFVALLALAQIPAEFYLTSFGAPGMDAFWGWNLALAAYAVRHLATLLVLIPFGALAFILFPAWIFLALARGPLSARQFTLRLLAIVGMAVSVFVAASWPVDEVRRARFQRAAERMTPLVAAIRRFEAERGRPPHELAELTPRYLATAQQFGVRGCRSLEYSLAPSNAAWRWELRLQCPNGMLTLDQFFFRPAGDYPAWDDLERMGEWAYFWD